MNLHKNKKEFKQLITLVSQHLSIPESAIERDYYIVLMLYNLSNSEYYNTCVFIGGTSLSKCYPNSINRFSEDIDLTFLGMNKSDNYCDKKIKKIEEIITTGFNTQKINEERNKRNKSIYAWLDDESKKIKLEIVSSVKPDPFSTKYIKSYIHEYLEKNNPKYIQEYELTTVKINTLNIERTFIDKIMAVKRHAICGNLRSKVRHIYDVTKLFQLEEIKDFLSNKDELKRLIKLTKETDSIYLTKRNIPKEYNPLAQYDFEEFKEYFNDEIRGLYENLHKTLLFTNDVQSFNEAINTFSEIDKILKSIGE